MHEREFRADGGRRPARVVGGGRSLAGASGVGTVLRTTSGGLVRLLGVFAGVAALAGAGCSPTIQWRFDTYDRVHAESRETNQLTFVYFRNWYAVACTEFEDNVLKLPAVIEATRDLRCVPLDFDWDRPLAEGWGIQRVPAFVIVDPDGRVLARGQGPITAEALLEAIRQAKETFAPATQSTGPP